MNIMQVFSMMQQGANPAQFLQSMASQNPIAGNLLQMMNGKNPKELENIARNMAQERGVDLNQVLNQMKR